MNPRPVAVVVLALMMLVGGLAGPLDPSTAAEPVKATQFHIQTFADGSGEAMGTVSSNSHLVVNVSVPAGGRVLSASVEVSRVRYVTSEMLLDSVPRDLWCGDLDNDGFLDDILVALPEADRVDLYSLMEGPPPSLVLRTSLLVPDPTAVAVKDLDRDNDEDILVTSGSGGRIYIFETLARDTFAEPRVIPVGPRPGDIAVNDLDLDFRWDVVVANSGGSSVSVLRGRGDLGFYPRLDEMGRGPSALRLRDMDKDQDVDLVVAESRNDTVSIWHNQGNGNFSNPTVLPTGAGPVDIDVTDLNSDSLVDIAVACSGSAEVWVYHQRDGGDFELAEVLPVGKAPRAVLGIHANKLEDTSVDVVTACTGSDNLTVHLAGGDLWHTIPLNVPVGGRPVALGTLKGSGSLPDRIAVACQMPPSIVLVTPVRVAEVIKLGFGGGGAIDRQDVPSGTENATLTITDGMNAYIASHHEEAMFGRLTVRIEAWATHAGVLRLSELDVWVEANRPPRADAGRNVTVEVGKPAELNGSASYDPDGGPLEYLWLLPGKDEPSHTDPVSLHVWNEPGTYPVLLVVKDQWGLADQDQVFVIVNAPPVAKGVVPASVNAREVTRLSAHLSEDPDGTIVDYVWDYSQGVVHGRSVDVMFTGTGKWNVTLMVIDDRGARSLAVYQVEVLPAITPLREPAEQVPEDRGEVPGPGMLLTSLAVLGAAALVARGRRRR